MKGKFLAKVVALSLVMATAVSTVVMTSTEADARRTFTYGQVTGEQAAYIKTIFMPQEYANLYPDLWDNNVRTDEELWAHFINCGIWEHRQPRAGLQIDCYASLNPDLHSRYGSDIPSYYVHYAKHAATEGWRATPTFDDCGRRGSTIYAVDDFVVGETAVRPGAIPVQTAESYMAYKKDVRKNDPNHEF